MVFVRGGYVNLNHLCCTLISWQPMPQGLKITNLLSEDSCHVYTCTCLTSASFFPLKLGAGSDAVIGAETGEAEW